jgi:predicted DNA-binding protein (MmcQ/YjbR family)
VADAKTRKAWARIHTFALGLPGAWEDHPWGETVVKVPNKKIFVFLGMPDNERPSIAVKLTDSHEHALSMPDAEPSGYGLGKAGWVLVRLQGVDVDLLEDWVEESYRNVATKKLIAELDARVRSH